MKICSTCKHESSDWARRCKNCYDVLDAPDDLPQQAVGIAAEFAIAGGILMALGPFLPFAESGEFAAAGLLKSGFESLTMVCAGAIVAVFGVLSLVLRLRFVHWYLPCAAATAAMTFYYQLSVESHLIHEHLGSTALGLGIYFCYLGSLFSFVAAAVCLVQRPLQPLKARLAGVAASLRETSFRQRPHIVVSYEEALGRKRRGL